MKYIQQLIRYSFLCIAFTSMHAQVKDISLTLSPSGEYVWWDNEAGLEDALLYGADIGFGFGEFLELKAIYKQGDDLDRDFSGFALPEGYESLLNLENNVDITRWGGELKTNFGTKKLSPFFILGTGVQEIETSFGTSTENIYATTGLGFKLNITDRIVFNIEGRNTFYNINTLNSLLSPQELLNLGLDTQNTPDNKTYNWSALASLQFYLGGRQPGELSELDKAYIQKLKGGFSGFKFIVEPAANYIEFDSDSSFRDTWLAGGYLGFEFNEYIGLHGFYFQATQDKELFNSFDDLAMYGLELRAKLNDGNGVIPYLVLGGGYLNAYENKYVTNDMTTANSSEFAKGGIGLEIPLSRYFSVNASASGMLTTDTDVEDLTKTESLQTHLNYSVGLNLHLGKKSKNPNKIYKNNLDRAVNKKENELNELYKNQLEERNQEFNERLQKLKEGYVKQIDSLNIKLIEARQNQNIEEAINILEQTKEIEENIKKVEEVQNQKDDNLDDKLPKNDLQQQKEVIIIQNKIQEQQQERPRTLGDMTPEEVEGIVDRIVSKYEARNKEREAKEQQERMFQEIQNLKNQLQQRPEPKESNEAEKKQFSEENEELKSRLSAIEKEILETKASEQREKEKQERVKEIELLNNKIKKLENQLDKKNNKERRDIIRENKIKDKELELLEKRMDKMDKDLNASNKKYKKLNQLSNSVDTIYQNTVTPTIKYEREYFNKFQYLKEEEKALPFFDKLIYKGSSAFTGFNIGQQSTIDLGARAHFGIVNTDFELMPELYVGLSQPTSFGLGLNAVHPFQLKLPYNISPYTGLGVGYQYIDENSNISGNVLIGFYANALNGRLFVNYTNRNLFQNNQFSVGYRFDF